MNKDVYKSKKTEHTINKYNQYITDKYVYLASGRMIFLLARAAGVDFDFSIAMR